MIRSITVGHSLDMVIFYRINIRKVVPERYWFFKNIVKRID